MRAYIRHPADVPIELAPAAGTIDEETRVRDVSIGGLRLNSRIALEQDELIRVRIPFVHPPFETVGKVVWCSPNCTDYEIGVQFVTEEDAFTARMVEQVCHIEHYRNEVMQHQGRDLTSEEAAVEWIQKYASEFPDMVDYVE